MKTFSGSAVFGGVAFGTIQIYERNIKQIRREHITDTESELKRFQEAKADAITQLQGLYEKALAEVGDEHAQIFEVHQMMLEDLDYLEAIEDKIVKESFCAEYAVSTTADTFAKLFSDMDEIGRAHV